ncbi:MAG: AsmA family protein [Azospirillaceae bacterium]|nr:AsmA family protein [Azospirillaceae bacterium]
MKKLLLAGLTLLVLLGGSVLVLPGLVDWNRYKDEIEARLGALTGRTVAIDGDIKLTLLPQPALTVAGVRIASLPGALVPDTASVERLEAEVGLWPLLQGRIQVQRVTLVDPLMALEILPDGQRSWTLALDTSALTDIVAFDQIRIRNGTVVWHRGDVVEQADKITGTVVAASLAGPIQAHLDFAFRSYTGALDLSLGRIGSNGAATPLRVALTTNDPKARVQFAGIVTGDRVQGDVHGQGADLLAVLAPFGAATPDVAASLRQPFSVQGVIVADRQGLVVNGLEYRLGDNHGSGALTGAAVPGVTATGTPEILTLAGDRLDLDAWQGTLRPLLEAWPTVAGVTVPPLGLDLSVDSLIWRAQTLQQVRLEGRLEGTTLTVTAASAELPGAASVTVAGSMARGQIDGNFELHSDNLRGLLDAAGIDATAVPADHLRSLEAAGRARINDKEVVLSDLNLKLDGSRISGDLSYDRSAAVAVGASRRIRLHAVADQVDLDAYRPAGAGFDPAWLAGLDLAGAVTAAELTVGGTAIRGLRLNGGLSAGTLSLTGLQIDDIWGVAVQATGHVEGVPAPRTGDVLVSIKTDSLRPSIAALGLTFPADRLGAVEGKAHLQAVDAAPWQLGVEITSSAGSLTLAGSVTDPLGTPSWQAKVRTTFPELSRLTALAASDYRPAGNPAGGVDLYGELRGGATTATVSDLQGTIGSVGVTGGVVLDWSGDRAHFDAQLQSGTIGIDTWLPAPAEGWVSVGRAGWSLKPINLDWLRGIDGNLNLSAAEIDIAGLELDRPALQATLDHGHLALEKFGGGFLDGKLGAQGQLDVSDPSAAPSARLTVAIAGAKVRHGLSGGGFDASGTLDLDLSVHGAGRNAADIASGVGATGRVTMRNGRLRGFDLDAAAQAIDAATPATAAATGTAINQALSAGETPFTVLTGPVAVDRGVVHLDGVRLAAAGGEAALAGTIDLPSWTGAVTTRMSFVRRADLPALILVLGGSLDAPAHIVKSDAVMAALAAARPEKPAE